MQPRILRQPNRLQISHGCIPFEACGAELPMGGPVFLVAAYMPLLGLDLVLLILERTGRNRDRKIGTKSP